VVQENLDGIIRCHRVRNEVVLYREKGGEYILLKIKRMNTLGFGLSFV